ncbi:hypothetical protein [Methylobacterium sp. D54C]
MAYGMPSEERQAGTVATAVRRILAREVLPGDVRKFKAKSNDKKSGGGARDIRLRPQDAFLSFMARMFPKTETVKRKLHGKKVEGTVRTGELHWFIGQPGDTSNERRAPIEVWDPTDARPGEVRLAKVHRYGLDDQLEALQFDEDTDRVLLLFVQMTDGRIEPRFVSHAHLNDPDWEPEAKAFLLRCFTDTPPGRAAQGWIDFEHGDSYPSPRR